MIGFMFIGVLLTKRETYSNYYMVEMGSIPKSLSTTKISKDANSDDQLDSQEVKTALNRASMGSNPIRVF